VTKRDLARAVAESLDIKQQLAKVVVQMTLHAIVETIATEGRAELRNFGVFETKRRNARKARNPRTGEKVDVAEKYVVTFKPGIAMQQRIESQGIGKIPSSS
jgi:nucleoid DNA-binding protein